MRIRSDKFTHACRLVEATHVSSPVRTSKDEHIHTHILPKAINKKLFYIRFLSTTTARDSEMEATKTKSKLAITWILVFIGTFVNSVWLAWSQHTGYNNEKVNAITVYLLYKIYRIRTRSTPSFRHASQTNSDVGDIYKNFFCMSVITTHLLIPNARRVRVLYWRQIYVYIQM